MIFGVIDRGRDFWDRILEEGLEGGEGKLGE